VHRILGLVASVITGVALERGVQLSSGRREAWDSEQYWTLGLPIALAVSLAVGFLSRGSAWLWTAAIVPSQVLTMMVRSGELGGLWPLAFALSTILSAPFVIAAFLGSKLRPSAWRV
jgi:hypothetical protein